MRKIYINEEHDDLFVFDTVIQKGIMYPLSSLSEGEVEHLCTRHPDCYASSVLEDKDALNNTMVLQEAIDSGAYTEITKDELISKYCVD